MSFETITDFSITHHTPSFINTSFATTQLVEKIKNRLTTDSTINLEIPLNQALELVEQLAEFDLGRFLLHNRAINGYWTAYIFRNQSKPNRHPLEEWFLNKSLLTCARERFYRFQDILQKNLHSNMKLASIPCGLMDDLLTLNYHNIDDFELVGIDLDEESLKLAQENAVHHNLSHQTTFLQKDAWMIEKKDEYNLITSNGLNMYESDPQRNIQLYRNFYKALKLNGLLIISFLPPPPNDSNPNCTWDSFGVASNDIKQERTIFGIILQAKFLNFCTEKDMIHQLECVGFKIEDINYSPTGVLPIAIARK